MSGKLTGEQNPRLTTGSYTVYQRFISGARSALSSWLPTSGTALFLSLQTLFMQGMSGKYEIPCEPNLSFHGRDTAEQCGAGRTEQKWTGGVLCPKDKIGAGPLVSRQERRAPVVPRVNRSLCSPIGLYDFVCSCFRRIVQYFFYDLLGGKREGCLLGEPIRRRPGLSSPPRPASPRRAPPRPTPLLYIRVLDSSGDPENKKDIHPGHFLGSTNKRYPM